MCYISLSAATAQAVAYVEYWTGVWRSSAPLARWNGLVILLFLVALPCAIAAKGLSRAFLLIASLLLFVVSFFIGISD